MLPQEFILKKRRGAELDEGELRVFFTGYAEGGVSEPQMAAMLMAIAFAGMSFDETIALTRCFLESGSRIDLTSIPGTKVDKHSTGGVGDKTSLLLAPIVAAAGVPVPMISGRALGHTGGTLDKLESIPGFRTQLGAAEFTDILRRCGMAMAGQSESLVPLDRRIYAMRDVTATIDVLPLIAASIMSKKIAGGADALVLDVKCGGGAFMKTGPRARELALLLVRVGKHFGLPTSGSLTAMDQPLGRAIGNQLEVIEAIECLCGADRPDLMEVTLHLAGAMIAAGRKASDIGEGIVVAREMVRSGLAFRKLQELVREQGGDASYIEEPLLFRTPRTGIDVIAGQDGFVTAIDARTLGLVALEAGAGRVASGNTIDNTAGIVLDKKVGDTVQRGDTLCRLYSSTLPSLSPLRPAANSAFTISMRESASAPLILETFDAEGVSLRPSRTAESEAT